MEHVPMEPHEEVQPVAAEIAQNTVHMSLSVWLIGGVAIMAFAGMLVGVMLKKNGPVAEIATATPTTESTASASPSAEATAVASSVDAGVSWLKVPVQLTDLNLTKKTDEWGEATYYKVGTDNGKDIIAVTIQPEGPSRQLFAYLVKSTDTTYEMIVGSSPDFSGDAAYFSSIFTTSVTRNTTTVYASIATKKTYTYKGKTMNLADAGWSQYFTSQITAGEGGLILTKLEDGVSGVFYQVDGTSIDGIVERAYLLEHPNGTFDYYQASITFVADDGVPAITWSDGSKNADTYRYDAVNSCGSATFNAVLTSTPLGDLAVIGTTSAGEKMYGFTSTTDAVVKDRYGFLTDGKYYDTKKNDYVAISIDEYLTKRGVVVYENSIGNLVLFTNTSYGNGAECGKPVVYLYPTKETKVSVKVGALVTKSEPTYGDGWDVLAQPNGQLMVNGSTYTSLFWEGTGNGSYPSVGRVGTVVAQADVVSTVKNQLSQLGLNTQESADFMEFWQPRLPKAPFVKLSWLGTREMNELAPLSISPKPDTMIRIFLDASGLQSSPDVLPIAQRLTSVPRKGFTVVEWGGLLTR